MRESGWVGGGGRGERQGERGRGLWTTPGTFELIVQSKFIEKRLRTPQQNYLSEPHPPLNQKIYLNPCTLHVLANIRSCSVTPNNTVTFISESVHFF